MVAVDLYGGEGVAGESLLEGVAELLDAGAAGVDAVRVDEEAVTVVGGLKRPSLGHRAPQAGEAMIYAGTRSGPGWWLPSDRALSAFRL
jgi:hypothetical protein